MRTRDRMKPAAGASVLDAETRELRRLIARSRRRIDRRLRQSRDDARRCISWRGVVRRYPWPCLLAALGAGLVVAGGLRSGRTARWLGAELFRGARRALGRGLTDDLAASAPWLAALVASRFASVPSPPRGRGSVSTAATAATGETGEGTSHDRS